ncbi:MAG: DUF421 domain-containing protein [Cyanobacteria bacterium QS_4_48_99]|nr:MAG: DUF421 domain-containing protein [Cyanobacteria bacterium QS_4_48_99]
MFNSWAALLHTLIIGSLAYVALIILLRISGKRTLSTWNAFDFIVTVAFGSTLASTLLSRDTSLIQGVLGFALLVFLQFIISWLSIRSKKVREWLQAEPTLLLHRGELQHKALKRERITEGEVRAALRAKGIAALEDVEAVVLETNGRFSVIEEIRDTSISALIDVKGYPRGTSRF